MLPIVHNAWQATRQKAGYMGAAASRSRDHSQLAEIETELEQLFGLMADEITLNFRRRLSDLHRHIPRQERDAAIKALRDWREAVVTTLRQHLEAKRHKARQPPVNQLDLPRPTLE